MIFKFILLSYVTVLCYAQYEGEQKRTSASIHPEKDDPCTDNNGQAGTCVKVDLCQSAVDAIAKKQFPKICSFDKSLPIVCCVKNPGPTTALKPVTTSISTTTTRRPVDESKPQVIDEVESRYAECQPIPARTEKKTGQKAFDKCIEYQEKYVYPCVRGSALLSSYSRASNCHHNADDLIIGGEDAARDEFPHMVMLRYGFDEKSKQYLCGGSIISDSFILSAAHCIAPTEQLDVTHVIVGALTVSEGNNKLNRYAVKNRITHPQYQSPFKYHDIALLETERRMKLSQYLVPACLHIGDRVQDDRVLATGWGQTKNKDASSVAENLQKVILQNFGIQKCVAKFIPHRHVPDGIDTKTQLCYGHKNESKDTCLGDSGGPIQIKSKRIHCMYVIVGITSFGKGCGFPGYPALYTKVSQYIPWIESIVWP